MMQSHTPILPDGAFGDVFTTFVRNCNPITDRRNVHTSSVMSGEVREQQNTARKRIMPPLIAHATKGTLLGMMAAYSETECWKLYVGNLWKTVTLPDLHALFSQFGRVTQCVYPMTDEGEFMRFAVVSFMERESANNAMLCCQGTLFHGHRMLVSSSFGSPWSVHRLNTLYVTNFSLYVDETVLWKVFEPKSACAVKIRWSVFGYRYAEVSFTSESAALAVLSESNGLDLGDGYKLKISNFFDLRNRGPVSPKQFCELQCMRKDASCLRVSNLTDRVDDEQLEKLFHLYGIVDCVIMLQAFEGFTGCSIVKYISPAYTKYAVQKLDGVEQDGQNIKVERVDNTFPVRWAIPVEPKPLTGEIVCNLYYRGYVRQLIESENDSPNKKSRKYSKKSSKPVHTKHFYVHPTRETTNSPTRANSRPNFGRKRKVNYPYGERSVHAPQPKPVPAKPTRAVNYYYGPSVEPSDSNMADSTACNPFAELENHRGWQAYLRLSGLNEPATDGPSCHVPEKRGNDKTDAIHQDRPPQ